MKSVQVYEGDGIKSHPRSPQPKPDKFILWQADWELITAIGNGVQQRVAPNKYSERRLETAYDTCRMIHNCAPNTVPKPYLLRRMRRLGILIPYIAEQYRTPLVALVDRIPPPEWRPKGILGALRKMRR